MATILIVDDERAARFGMKKALARKDYQIHEAEDGEQAWKMLSELQPDLIFLDLNMPKCNGMEFLKRMKELTETPLIIVVTAHGSEKIAVEAMKKGAYDYLAKPYEVDELRLIADHALEKITLYRENKRLLEEIRRKERFGELVGESQPMMKIYDLIEKVAKSDVTVLIEGESGTGKELVAREIYKRSNRVKKKFVAMNCAAIPENLIESELFGHEKGAFTGAGEQRIGKIEEAHEGTLFLDEIGDMTLDTQAKVLRALQEKTFERLGSNKNIKVDVRFIAATNKNLQEAIKKGFFREDLYYRIKVIDIHLPPLRQRISDISCLVNHFIELFAGKYGKKIQGMTPDAIQQMTRYNWPGNVRELRHVIEKSLVLSDGEVLMVEDLPNEILQGNSEELCIEGIRFDVDDLSFRDAKKKFVQEFERNFITRKLKMHKGNISKTAQSLEMPRQSLQQKLKELAINARELNDE